MSDTLTRVRLRGWAGLGIALVMLTAGCADGAPGSGAEPGTDSAPASAQTGAPAGREPAGADANASPDVAAASSAAPASTGPATLTAPRHSSARTPTMPATGTGTWQTVKESSSATGSGRTFKVAVRVESNLPISGKVASRFVMRTLRDRRGWQKSDGVRFALVATASAADVVISIATPGTTDRLCAPLNTAGKLSCRNGRNVVFNARRWTKAATGFASLTQYRHYLVSHEVGHALGHGHRSCGGAGRTAPVMMQQTKGLKGCKPNGWPHP